MPHVRALRTAAALGDAAVRLLECLRSPVDAAVLGPAIKREITSRVLCGPRGEALFAMLGRNGHAAQIHAVLRRMHARYAEPLNVARMAAEVGMSVSALHHHFKAVTADRVGYESASQFSREFKRLFGRSPIEDSRRVRGMSGQESTEDEPVIDLGNRIN